MTPKYIENQSGLWIVVMLLGFMTVPLFFVLGEDNYSQENLVAFLLLAVLIPLLCAILFYKLKTEVFSDQIKVSFGIGLIKKQIELKHVTEVKVVKNSWLMGWGIRYILNGWMWNIWGLKAVELHFSNKKSIFRIGSQDPVILKQKIEDQLIE